MKTPLSARPGETEAEYAARLDAGFAPHLERATAAYHSELAAAHHADYLAALKAAVPTTLPALARRPDPAPTASPVSGGKHLRDMTPEARRMAFAAVGYKPRRLI